MSGIHQPGMRHKICKRIRQGKKVVQNRFKQQFIHTSHGKRSEERGEREREKIKKIKEVESGQEKDFRERKKEK